MSINVKLYMSSAFFVALTQTSLADVSLINEPDSIAALDGISQAKEMPLKDYGVTPPDEGFTEDDGLE